MKLNIEVELDYILRGPTDLLVQIEIAEEADQVVVASDLTMSTVDHFDRVSAESGIGTRIWVRTDKTFQCTYKTAVVVNRPKIAIDNLQAVSPHQIPGNVVRYLMPSRFCPSDQFQNFVGAEFGELSGGARISAMRDWINQAFEYSPGSSTAETTALDSFVQRRGVCRDFAHVMVTLARASTIPARFASVYAPDVDPPDFHAVAEVYLDDLWHLVDATGMAPSDTIARIGVGCDAAEVSFLTGFGPMRLRQQSVSVSRDRANKPGSSYIGANHS